MNKHPLESQQTEFPMADEEQLERLKQGVEAWNEWRSNNSEVEIDLRQADLSRANLSRVTLKMADLSGADLSRANLSRANLSRANLSRADLRGADLSGTDFPEADLSEANLTGIDLSNAYFTGANLSRANLSRADLRGTDLSNADLNGATLSGAYLNGEDLSEADFRKANLSRVNLRTAYLDGFDFSGFDLSGANFSGAILSRVQALDTNFTGALFTGACIEDWHINSETRLDDVDCEYIYLKANKQERRPSEPNRSFVPGEFTKLFQEAHNTFDLILHNGINWRAFAFAFNETNTEVIDEYGDRLFLRGYELLGDGIVKLKISYPEGTNSQKYQNLLEESYELLKENKGLLKENARLQVKEYENMLSLPGQVIVIGDNNSVDTRNINTGGGSYYETINTGGGNYIQGNYVNMSQDLTEAAAQIQELLNQLQKSGVTVEAAQEQVATDLAKQAESNPTVMGKLVGWGKTMANKASETTVSEAAKAIVPLALKLVGIPLP